MDSHKEVNQPQTDVQASIRERSYLDELTMDNFRKHLDEIRKKNSSKRSAVQQQCSLETASLNTRN